jgi:hypothetical protein
LPSGLRAVGNAQGKLNQKRLRTLLGSRIEFHLCQPRALGLCSLLVPEFDFCRATVKVA